MVGLGVENAFSASSKPVAITKLDGYIYMLGYQLNIWCSSVFDSYSWSFGGAKLQMPRLCA